jgi:hypothetical protein
MLKEVEDFPGYFVSDDGKVYSDKRGEIRELKPQNNGFGYFVVGLCRNNKYHSKKIHRLVALAFIPNPKNKPEINHIDGVKTNNNISNLEWATTKENTRHAWETGLNENVRKAFKINGKNYGKINGKKNGKKVICIETQQVFNSAVEASRHLGLNNIAVNSSIRKKYKCGGFTWKYLF